MHNIPFDGLATFFIFLIGVPALVIQGMPREMRSVLTSSRARMWKMVAFTGVWILGAIAIAGFFVWYMVTYCDVPTEGKLATCPLPFPPYQMAQDWVQIALLGALTLLTAVASILVVRRYSRRTTMVESLRHEIESTIKRTGLPEPIALNDMIELGEHSGGGQDKEYVLNAIQLLVQNVITGGKYRGDSLETVVQGLVKVIATDPLVGSSENYVQATDILLDVVKGNPNADGTSHTPDVHHCAEVLGALGKAALRELEKHLSGDKVAIGFVDALGRTARRQVVYVNLVAESLREIGIEAVDKERMLVAMRVLNELTALLASYGRTHPEVQYDTVSLMAHFWDRGNATEQFIEMRLAKIMPDVNVDKPKLLKNAFLHSAHTGNFVTADKIRKMASELKGAMWEGGTVLSSIGLGAELNGDS